MHALPGLLRPTRILATAILSCGLMTFLLYDGGGLRRGPAQLPVVALATR